MTEEDLKLLSAVRSKCLKDASFLTHIINAGVSGVSDAEKEMRHMAADMETMASAMCFLAGQSRVSPKLKEQMSNLALLKLGKYHEKSFINWSSNIVADKDR